MFCPFLFDVLWLEYILNMSPNHRCSIGLFQKVSTSSIILKNPCLAFFHCAKPICNRNFFLWHTKSIADLICFLQNSKIHPVHYYILSLFLIFPFAFFL